MTIRKHLHNLLTLLDDPLSITELAEAECLPPVLGISNISILMYPDFDKLQKGVEIALKTAIRNNELSVLSVAECSRLIMDWERSRDIQHYKEPGPSCIGLSCIMTAVGNVEKDLLPDSADVKFDDRKMYVVHKDYMKKWLQKENEWPLDDDNLLSRWWPGAKQDKEKFFRKDIENSSQENIFRKEGPMWTLRYCGVTKHFNSLKGLLYISYLLGSPDKEFHAQQLFATACELNIQDSVGIGGVRSSIDQNQAGSGQRQTNVKLQNPLIDEKALKEYKSQIQKLEQLIEQANTDKDFASKERYEGELEVFQKEIIAATGLRGKGRGMSDDAEKARKSVSEAIRRALKRIQQEHKNLYLHLNNSITLGEYCIYNPEEEINWLTSKK